MNTRRVDFSELPDVSKLHPELDEDERGYAAHMKAREDAFKAIFGESEPPDQILSPDDPDLVVNWPGGGVYQYPPRGDRRGWHYVTHGLSQPSEVGSDDDDDDDERSSGLGIELVLSTPERSDWPPKMLIQFVKYLLFNENARLFLPGHRIPASGLREVSPGTALTHFFGLESNEYASEITLPAGSCTLVHLVGATANEIERAKGLPQLDGTFVLAEVLRQLGVGFVTDVSRRCATVNSRFDAAWEQVKQTLAND